MSKIEIDWDEVNEISRHRHPMKLSEFLKQLPHILWNAVNSDNNYTFVHYASRSGNDDALIMILTSQVNVILCNGGPTPLQVASLNCNNRAIEILCTFDTSLISKCADRGRNWDKLPIEWAVNCSGINKSESIYTLIANGARLKDVRQQNEVTQEMRDFEAGVLSCRETVIILLGLKKKRVILHELDRFLIRQELAVAIWTTRREQEWQK